MKIYIQWRRQRINAPRSFRRQIILKPGHPELWACTFLPKKKLRFLIVVLKTQAANAADCFTVKIKQIKAIRYGNIFISVQTITEAKQ